MDKMTGDCIDLLSIHTITQKHIELLNSYTNLLTEVEALDNNMKSMKLIEDSEDNLIVRSNGPPPDITYVQNRNLFSKNYNKSASL